MSDSSALWPAHFVAAGISPDHCRDVLAGAYDIPFNPAQPPVILDLGANIGAFARWAATRWPGATIHCYEPHPGNFALLQETVQGIAGAVVHPVQSAVLKCAGHLPLRLATTNCGAHSFYETGEVGESSILVPVVAAAELPRADILKIDTEGAEEEILEALEVSQALPACSAVVLEYHADAAAERIHALLASHGFVLLGHRRHCPHRGELRYMRAELTTAPRVPFELRPRVYLGTPSHDHKFHALFAFSVLRLAVSRVCAMHISKVGGAGVARARNNQAADFLRGEAEWFLAIDSDIGFEPAHVARLLSHGRPLVCGLYPLKQRELAWCLNTLPGETIDEATGLQKVARAGTGFMLAHRSVFERMREAHPELAYTEDLDEARGDTRWDFFSMGVVGPGSPSARLELIRQVLATVSEPVAALAQIRAAVEAVHPPGRYNTEDWYFCDRARALGIDVYVDCTFHVAHEGMITYPLDPVEMS